MVVEERSTRGPTLTRYLIGGFAVFVGAVLVAWLILSLDHGSGWPWVIGAVAMIGLAPSPIRRHRRLAAKRP